MACLTFCLSLGQVKVMHIVGGNCLIIQLIVLEDLSWAGLVLGIQRRHLQESGILVRA